MPLEHDRSAAADPFDEALEESVEELYPSATQDSCYEPAPTEAREAVLSNKERAIRFLQGLSGREVDRYARELFGANHYQRLVFHSWVATIRNRDNPEIDPASYPINLVGAPGGGKSGALRNLCRTVERWLRAKGYPVPVVQYRVTLAGVNDFADVIGVTFVDKESDPPVARVAVPSDFPTEKDGTLGFFDLDDFNRGHEHCMSGAMIFLNAFRYNNVRVPRGFAFTLSCNPPGQGYRTRPLDPAQESRLISIPYEPEYEIFIDQIVAQGGEREMLAYFSKYKDVAKIGKVGKFLREPRVVNWRNAMIFIHMFPSIKYDPVLLDMVAFSIFGPNEMRNLKALIAGEMPLAWDEILGVGPEEKRLDPERLSPEEAATYAVRKLGEFDKMNRTDLTSISCRTLTMKLNSPDCTLSEQQVDALAGFLLKLPKEFATLVAQRIFAPSAPRRLHYLNMLTFWRSEQPGAPGPLGRYFIETKQATAAEIEASLRV